MPAKINTAVLSALQAKFVSIEVASRVGCPQLVMIGLPSAEIKEAKERILSALISCGVKLKHKRTIINLAPADLPKSGASLDLAIAAGLLLDAQLIKNFADKTFLLGELSLDGTLKKVKGFLTLALAAKKQGFKEIIYPADNNQEASLLKGLILHPVKNLKQFIDCVNGFNPWPQLSSYADLNFQAQNYLDMSEIIAQTEAKRVLEIAAAGAHHCLMLGPPGCGKTSLAQAFPGILPSLTQPELLAIYQLDSLLGKPLQARRPFRHPNSSLSKSALLGGANKFLPGELVLANHGVLFLDEFFQLKTEVIEALRQPLEDKRIFLAKGLNKITYPANFILIAASNACACGFLGSSRKICKCSANQLNQFKRKLSGPVFERIDLKVFLTEVNQDLFTQAKTSPESSATIRKRVELARKQQQLRFTKTNYLTNSEVQLNDLKKFFICTPKAKRTLNLAYNTYGFSYRVYSKVLKIARSIADLAGREKINEDAVLEALIYRAEDQNLN